ncbi:MAG: hypothetical protein JJ897_11680 [Marinibacterium sp.]|nr:hypothetical protein [Marinibacterium sp.]
MPKTSATIAKPKPQGATRIGTQGTILQGVDMRTHGGRRFKELCADLVDHLDGDPTAPQFAIIRRAAALAVWCEQAEAAQAQGGELDVAAYGSAANTMRRLLCELGLERRAKDVTSLSEYIAKREASA